MNKKGYSLNRSATGIAILDIIRKKNRTIEAVAKQMKTCPSHLREILNGEKSLRLVDACLLSQILDTDIEAFVVLNYGGDGRRLYEKRSYTRGLY